VDAGNLEHAGGHAAADALGQQFVQAVAQLDAVKPQREALIRQRLAGGMARGVPVGGDKKIHGGVKNKTDPPGMPKSRFVWG